MEQDAARVAHRDGARRPDGDRARAVLGDGRSGELPAAR
jgi:hypothetical protein